MSSPIYRRLKVDCTEIKNTGNQPEIEKGV